MLDSQWAPWLEWLLSQLDDVHDTHLDFTGADFLDWLNGASMQETVSLGQPSLHSTAER